ncbi:unnamed protein product [Parnassius apollo]|nr:unnamed protein product [Parnassius apollo]
MRTEKKTNHRGDKAIRFRFPYKKTTDSGEELSIKVVKVTTFKEMEFTKQVEDNKLILIFRQAGLLAMVTFSKAISYCYNTNASKLLTPLCGAIFSRDSIKDMAQDLGVEEVKCLRIVNESATSGGQYLPDSDIACAVVCTITSAKRLNPDLHFYLACCVVTHQNAEKCKDDWNKLRNSYVNALKRRKNKKSGQAAQFIPPWKYEEQMSFLQPFMESRSTTTNLSSPPESPEFHSESTQSNNSRPATPHTGSSSHSQQPVRKPNLQDLYDMMKSSHDLRIHKHHSKQQQNNMTDETDLFFLSMSKAVKKLPKLDQTKIKLDLH